MSYYDYRLRLQVQPGTPQEATLRYLKTLSEDPQFGEKQRTILALCCYWSVEALAKQGAPKETIQDLASSAILEMAYQMQSIAELSGIDLEDLEMPEPVFRLVRDSHPEVRSTFVSALVSGGERVGRKGTARKVKASKPLNPPEAPDVLEEIKPVKSSPRQRPTDPKKPVNGAGFSTNLFGS